jgi:predicted ATPase/DNA-binding winged helix-turn-helix (wHTH) protein
VSRAHEQALAFGSFQLLRERKVLLDNQRPVRIGSRALDVLVALVERAGEVVGKNELIAYAWPDTFVEETNLRVHIAAIRKLLGDGQGDARFIVNVAGRGYSFIAPVSRVHVRDSDAQSPARSRSSLPVALTRVIGREEAINAVVELATRRRLVTILGPGGIGKTTLGVTVADRLAQNDQQVCFIDLAAVAEAALVPILLATSVGVMTPTDDPIAAVIDYLRPTRTLLMLDNCEHVVACIAPIVERILHGAAGVAILATSRERLLAEGEYVYALGPLQCPPAQPAVTAQQATRFSAIQLFVERAFSANDGFAIDEGNVATIAAICRRLDSIPLAIELVAARVGTLGLGMLAESLEQHLLVLSKGRRSANARHQSLSATLNWSFRLLTPVEQTVLRRLASFSGSFSVESAIAVAAGGVVAAADVPGALMSLAGKSLLTADTGGQSILYRLLHVTRAFAAGRLIESDEAAVIMRRHAEYHRDLLQAAESDWETLARIPWLARHGHVVDDVRAALQWAFGPGGDVELGAALIVASLPFGFQLSLHEFERRASIALDRLERASPARPIAELRLRTALVVLQFQAAAPDDAIEQQISVIMALAERIAVPRLMTEALTARAVLALERVDYVAAVQGFEALQAVAKQADDAFAALIADRLGAQVFHWAGDQAIARVRAERVLRHPSSWIPLVYGQGPVDKQVSMRIVLARIAWLEGRPDEAERIAAEALDNAGDSPIAVCQALGFAACPIAFWRGDYTAAARSTVRLLDYSRRYSFTRWYRLAQCFEATLAMFAVDANAAGADRQVMAASPEGLLQRDLLGTIAGHWVDPASVGRAESGQSGWCTAELLRVAGKQRLSSGGPEAWAAAESRYKTALHYARNQGTLSWELRTATSLAQLRLEQGRRTDAVAELASVYEKIREGHDTADMRAARELLVASC